MILDDLLELKRLVDAMPPVVKAIYVLDFNVIESIPLSDRLPNASDIPVYIKPGLHGDEAEIEYTDGWRERVLLRRPMTLKWWPP